LPSGPKTFERLGLLGFDEEAGVDDLDNDLGLAIKVLSEVDVADDVL